MTASSLSATEHLSVVLAGRLAQGCRAARVLRPGPWPAEGMTTELVERVLDVRAPELHWTAHSHRRGPGQRVGATGPVVSACRPCRSSRECTFLATPALLETQPRRVPHGRPGTA